MKHWPTFFVNVKLWLNTNKIPLSGASGHQEYKSGGHLEL